MRVEYVRERMWDRVQINCKRGSPFLIRQTAQPASHRMAVSYSIYPPGALQSHERFPFWWLNSSRLGSQGAGEQNERSDLTSSPLITSPEAWRLPGTAGGTNILPLSKRCCLDAQDLCDVGRCGRSRADFPCTGSADYTRVPMVPGARGTLGSAAADILISRFPFLWCRTFLRLRWKASMMTALREGTHIK